MALPANGTVTLNADGSFVYTPNMDFIGTDTFEYQVNDGRTPPLAGKATVTITVTDGNQPPTVNAGPDQTVILPKDMTFKLKNGTVDDDGRPTPPALTTAWTQVSGPGTVTFLPPTAVVTEARFSSAGTYPLRLEANDGELLGSDVVVIRVKEENCEYDYPPCPIVVVEKGRLTRISEMTPDERVALGFHR